MGKGIVREFGTDMYTWLHLNGYQRGPAIWHRETHSVSQGWLDGREVCGRMNTCPFVVNLKLWLTGYTPIQNKMFLKSKQIKATRTSETWIQVSSVTTSGMTLGK